MQPVGIDERMALGLDDAGVLHADALELGRQGFGGAAAVGGMFRRGRDRRDAQQVFQFAKKARVVLLGIGNCGRRHGEAPSN